MIELAERTPLRVLVSPQGLRELWLQINATVSAERIRRDLAALDREKVKFQVSLDGARPETNDPIRGAGTFVRALAGAAALVELGYQVSLTTVTTEHNLDELLQIPRLVRRLGAASQHLMWSHKRGRAQRGYGARQPRGGQAPGQRCGGGEVRPGQRRLGLALRLRRRTGLPVGGPRRRGRAHLRSGPGAVDRDL